MATRDRYVAWIGQHLISAGIGEVEAQEKAEAALMMFLREEEIEFDHPDYNWHKESAEITAEEYLQSTEEQKALVHLAGHVPQRQPRPQEGVAECTREVHVAWIGQYLIASGIDEGEAQEKAEAALTMFLHEEEIEFGHDSYNWDKESAEITAEEYLEFSKKGSAA